MKTPAFSQLTEQEQEWFDSYLNATITPADFELLQQRLLENPALRIVMRRYLALDHSLNDLCAEPSSADWSTSPAEPPTSRKTIAFPSPLPLAAAAVAAFLLGAALMSWKTAHRATPAITTKPETPSAQGFAVIHSLFNATWTSDTSSHREGDTLGSETFQLASGLAEIQFFSGANMTVEGPARIVLKSAWEAECQDGLVRMLVPPAARGFKLLAPTTEIIDLGTEFGLSVRDGKGHVEVIDGEISIKHRDEAKKLLQKGTAYVIPENASSSPTPSGSINYPDASSFQSKAAENRHNAWQRWQTLRDELTHDERLIAYYPFDQPPAKKRTPNIRLPRDPDLDGTIVLAESVPGRWYSKPSALEFRHPGSRVRVNIPGEFPAFTFAAWVRIDSLDRRYNALFMADGYENGEPHWQIRDDGKLMLSIMVDQTKPSTYSKDSAGRHKVYFSPPIWQPSMSGEWIHLASVYDPQARRVAHFVNGKLRSEEPIEDLYHVRTLRIGNAEIGNWGDPFRKDPEFAIRNLNGCFDEVAIFKSALSDDQIAELYQNSTPAGR